MPAKFDHVRLGRRCGACVTQRLADPELVEVLPEGMDASIGVAAPFIQIFGHAGQRRRVPCRAVRCM